MIIIGVIIIIIVVIIITLPNTEPLPNAIRIPTTYSGALRNSRNVLYLQQLRETFFLRQGFADRARAAIRS